MNLKLTEKEKILIGMIVNGKSQKCCASELGRSIKTIQKRMCIIYKKLDVHNYVELIKRALKDNIVDYKTWVNS